LIHVYVDGSGKGKISFYIRNTEETIVRDVRVKSHNEAEYLAILEALKYIEENIPGIDGIAVYSDSQVVVKQLRREYNVAAENLRELAMKIWDIVSEFKKSMKFIEFHWVPRNLNPAGKVLG